MIHDVAHGNRVLRAVLRDGDEVPPPPAGEGEEALVGVDVERQQCRRRRAQHGVEVRDLGLELLALDRELPRRAAARRGRRGLVPPIAGPGEP